MTEEEYKQIELELISLAEKSEEEINNLEARAKEALKFLIKVQKNLQSKNPTISKKIVKTGEYINLNSLIVFILESKDFYDNQISELYEQILKAQDFNSLNAVKVTIEYLINSVKGFQDELEEDYLDFRKALSPKEMVSLEENPRNLPFNKNLARVKYSTSENFVTKTGLTLRKLGLKVMQNALKSASRRNTIIEEYHPEFLEGKTPEEVDRTNTLVEVEKVTGLDDDAYIFAPNHLFDEESNSMSISLDRLAYYLVGSTDQIDHNPVLNFLWLSGIAYVNRQDKDSRKDSVCKMEKLLENKTSVIEYIEGRYNNTENKLVEGMFYSAFELWEKTGKKVVPVSTHTTLDASTVYVCFGKPLDFTGMNKYEARDLIREKIAEMHYEQIRQHSIPLTREYLDSRKDYHLDYMIARRQEYCHHKWYDDVWDEELTGFIDKNVTSPEEVRASLDNVRVTPQNAHILAPTLARREQDKKYDFKQFMKDTYDKDIRALYPDNDILDFEYQKEKGKSRQRTR